MRVLSHRGLWRRPEEKNTLEAFSRSFDAGFGAEIDVRDERRQLVVSHDPPAGDTLLLRDVLDVHRRLGPELPLALNVKSCGLALALSELVEVFSVRDYFVFDMAVPDALDYVRQGVPAFTRISEHETEPAFYAKASGVWLDCFQEDWVEQTSVSTHLAAGKAVVLVSPELHGRAHEQTWERWGKTLPDHRNLFLCTDHPEAAQALWERIGAGR